MEVTGIEAVISHPVPLLEPGDELIRLVTPKTFWIIDGSLVHFLIAVCIDMCFHSDLRGNWIDFSFWQSIISWISFVMHPAVGQNHYREYNKTILCSRSTYNQSGQTALMIDITSNIQLSEDELEFRFILASGPGGQNVNKVATAVQLRYDTVNSTALSKEVRARLLKLAGSRVTKEGELLITARRYRTQERNRQDAIDRLVALIQQAAVRPKPRLKRKPSKAAKKRRLDGKRRQAEKKNKRRAVKV